MIEKKKKISSKNSCSRW